MLGVTRSHGTMCPAATAPAAASASGAPPHRLNYVLYMNMRSEHNTKSYTSNTQAQAVVVHGASTPSPRKKRPEEGKGMGKEWEGGG
eukprot:scaffold3777_cov123-Isochrysis_galbana.AAC.3